MATEEFLAMCSTEEFESHLSTLDGNGTKALRDQLFAKARLIGGDKHPEFNRIMEQLAATRKQLVRLGLKK